MTARHALTAIVLGVLAGGAGCVTCRHTGFAESVRACGATPVPCPARQKVYVFAMNGADVCDLCGLTSLRDHLCGRGFPKVYVATTADRGWYEREVRKIRRDDPAARFVFVGVGAAAETVVALASSVARDGAAVDAAVFLDPVGVSANLSAGVPYRTVAVRSRLWPSSGLIAGENLTVPAGHFALPNHEITRQTLVNLLTECGTNVGPLDGPALPFLPLTDTPLPTPRPVVEPPSPVRDEWDFLKLPGGPLPLAQPGTAVTEAPAPTPPFVPTSRPRP